MKHTKNRSKSPHFTVHELLDALCSIWLSWTSKTLVPVFLYSNNQIKVNRLSCQQSSQCNGPSTNNFHHAKIFSSYAPPSPLPVPALFLKVGRQYQSSWWMLAWRVVSTKQCQMTNDNILYTHPVILKVVLLKNFRF